MGEFGEVGEVILVGAGGVEVIPRRELAPPRPAHRRHRQHPLALVDVDHQRAADLAEVAHALNLVSVLPCARQRRQQDPDQHRDDADDDQQFDQCKAVPAAA